MDEFKLGIFQSEIGTQSEFVLLAAKELDKVLRDPPRMSTTGRAVGHTTQIWYLLQTILVSAANISKLLWGSEEADAPRDDLRESLEVEADSPIRSKRVRNAFEHFDEFIENMPNTIFIGRNIGAQGSIVVEGHEPATRFGQFDPSTGEVTFWERTTNVVEVVREVERIFAVLQTKRGY